MLVENGANANDTNVRNISPVFDAICKGIKDEGIYRCLANLGADYNGLVTVESVIFKTLKLKDCDILEYLIKKGATISSGYKKRLTTIGFTLDKDQGDLMKTLVDCGTDINLKYDLDLPLLWEAVQMGRPDMVRTLVDHGAEIDLMCIMEGIDALCHALIKMSNGHQNISKDMNTKVETYVKQLLQLGAKVNVVYKVTTIVHKIVLQNDFKMIKLLGELGANLNMGYLTGRPLIWETLRLRPDMLGLFIKKGADLNVKSDFMTPLHLAVKYSNRPMVQTLVELGADVNNSGCATGLTLLIDALHQHNIDELKILLPYGPDMKSKCDVSVTPLHLAVKNQDIDTVKLLAKLGANLDLGKTEGVDCLNYTVMKLERNDMTDVFKMLLEAGADMNHGPDVNVTALHDAVRMRDKNLVKTLVDLGADLYCGRLCKMSTLSWAVASRLWDIITILSEHGADMNVTMRQGVMPSHDALISGDTDIQELLTKFIGKNRHHPTLPYKARLTPLHSAVLENDSEMVKFLAKAGADINATVIDIFLDHMPGFRMYVFTDHMHYSTLSLAVESASNDVVEALVEMGYDVSQPGCLDVSVFSQDIRKETSSLHAACRQGNIEIARLLMIAGIDTSELNADHKKWSELLPVFEGVTTRDYRVLQEAATAKNVIQRLDLNTSCFVVCPRMASIRNIPTIGNVLNTHAPTITDIIKSVHQFMHHLISYCATFSQAKMEGCGSSHEGTKVGLPDEMDFLFMLDLAESEARNIENVGNGYARYKNQRDKFFKTGSESYHNRFSDKVSSAEFRLKLEPGVYNLSVYSPATKPIRKDNRKACSPILLRWSKRVKSDEEQESELVISVDLVPCLHVDGWPDGALTQTWLMDEQALRRRGYLLVPKPPHVKSALSKEFTPDDLQALWRISFTHLEKEHMTSLDQHIRDVYVTAKALRNPDVSRVMVTDDGSFPKYVDKYITSYQLKTSFLNNVEYFMKSDLAHEEMVCKVYDDLAENLSKKFIPEFFMPKVNILSGLKLDLDKCAEVAKIMRRFVHALYLRDRRHGMVEMDTDEEIIVYQRKPTSVYKSYAI